MQGPSKILSYITFTIQYILSDFEVIEDIGEEVTSLNLVQTGYEQSIEVEIPDAPGTHCFQLIVTFIS